MSEEDKEARKGKPFDDKEKFLDFEKVTSFNGEIYLWLWPLQRFFFGGEGGGQEGRRRWLKFDRRTEVGNIYERRIWELTSHQAFEIARLGTENPPQRCWTCTPLIDLSKPSASSPSFNVGGKFPSPNWCLKSFAAKRSKEMASWCHFYTDGQLRWSLTIVKIKS